MPKGFKKKEKVMSAPAIILLVLLLVGVLATWRNSANWGYAPSSRLGLVLLGLVILSLIGRI
jgi:uncharacterized protein DUF3309